MENLFNYLTEATVDNIQYCKQNEGWNHINYKGTVSWFSTSQSCIEGLKQAPHKYFSKLSEHQIEELVNEIYELCKDNSKNGKYEWDTAPLVFNKFKVSLRRRYFGLQNYILKKYNIKLDLHNGFGVSYRNGIEFELQVQAGIINFLQHVIQYDGLKDNTEPEDITDRKGIPYIFELYKQGGLNDIIFDLKNDKSIDLKDRIIITGNKDTKRNLKGQIINTSTFEISKNIKNIIRNSGEIIADITIISSKGPQYISVKKKEAQNTSINVRCVSNYLKYGKNEEGYNNFCKTFGLDPEELRDTLINHKNTNLKISNPNLKDIENLIKMIVGGNYWYLNPDGCRFVNELNGKLEKITNIRTTNKQLVIDATFNNKNVKIVFRTDQDNEKYPYRFFVIFDMFEFF